MNKEEYNQIYVDVDGTIIDHNGNLNPYVSDCLSKLTKWFQLVCWSFGGKDYAEAVCKEHNIDKYFHKFMTKPQIVIDDEMGWMEKYPRKFNIKNGNWEEVMDFCNIPKKEDMR